MSFIDYCPIHRWFIDWDKVKTVEDVIVILKNCDLTVKIDPPDELKALCYMADDRGVEVDPLTLLPKAKKRS